MNKFILTFIVLLVVLNWNIILFKQPSNCLCCPVNLNLIPTFIFRIVSHTENSLMLAVFMHGGVSHWTITFPSENFLCLSHMEQVVVFVLVVSNWILTLLQCVVSCLNLKLLHLSDLCVCCQTLIPNFIPSVIYASCLTLNLNIIHLNKMIWLLW